MQFFIYLAVFIGIFPSVVQAQTYYNAPPGSGSGPVYNAPRGTYGVNSPLNIQGILRGNTTSKSSGYKSRASKRPHSYGPDRSRYALSLTPQQVKENEKKREQAVAIRAREKEKERQQRDAQYNSTSETQKYLSQFQGSNRTAQKSVRKRVVYNRNATSNFRTPKRVFNSPY